MTIVFIIDQLLHCMLTVDGAVRYIHSHEDAVLQHIIRSFIFVVLIIVNWVILDINVFSLKHELSIERACHVTIGFRLLAMLVNFEHVRNVAHHFQSVLGGKEGADIVVCVVIGYLVWASIPVTF